MKTRGRNTGDCDKGKGSPNHSPLEPRCTIIQAEVGKRETAKLPGWQSSKQANIHS